MTTNRPHPAPGGPAAGPRFTILIDGLCPLCKHESRMMARLDRGRGRLKLVDIAEPGFDPGVYGRTMNDVMGSIHGVTPDGRVVSGPEVFRLAYGAVGYGWLWAPTGWPVLRPIFDRLYRVFARLRLKLTSHPDAAACAAAGRCKLPTRGTPASGAMPDARA